MEAVRFIVGSALRITGRPLVLLGILESGTVRKGDDLFLVRGELRLPLTVVGLDIPRRGSLEKPGLPNAFGLEVRGLTKDQVQPGDLVTDD